jgi:transcriptional regulator with XRE-family HTH domain
MQIYQARHDLGYTQEEAAHAGGIAPPAFGRMERARFEHSAWVNPTLETLVRLHGTLDINPHRWIRSAYNDVLRKDRADQ